MSVARVRDLVCLVADSNMQQSTRGILGRWRALGIREPFHEILVHPQHDPGCLHDAVDFLRPFSRRYEHALVLFDHEGCGKEDTPRQDLENELEGALAQAGWTDRAAVVVIEPELEAWVWSESPHVAKSLGWKDTMETLHAWLREHELLEADDVKPNRPKEAMEEILYQVRKPRSSAIYGEIAGNVGLERCVDDAFLKLKHILREWFPGRL